jgi:hypothetical protein
MTPWMRTKEDFNRRGAAFTEDRFPEDQHVAGEK